MSVPRLGQISNEVFLSVYVISGPVSASPGVLLKQPLNQNPPDHDGGSLRKSLIPKKVIVSVGAFDQSRESNASSLPE